MDTRLFTGIEKLFLPTMVIICKGFLQRVEQFSDDIKIEFGFDNLGQWKNYQARTVSPSMGILKPNNWNLR